MPRQYANYWNILKTKKKLTLAMPEAMMLKVVRMLRKEKDEDIVFKMESSPKKWRIKATYIRELSQIRFTLVETQFSAKFEV